MAFPSYTIRQWIRGKHNYFTYLMDYSALYLYPNDVETPADQNLIHLHLLHLNILHILPVLHIMLDVHQINIYLFYVHDPIVLWVIQWTIHLSTINQNTTKTNIFINCIEMQFFMLFLTKKILIFFKWFLVQCIDFNQSITFSFFGVAGKIYFFYSFSTNGSVQNQFGLLVKLNLIENC